MKDRRRRTEPFELRSLHALPGVALEPATTQVRVARRPEGIAAVVKRRIALEASTARARGRRTTGPQLAAGSALPPVSASTAHTPCARARASTEARSGAPTVTDPAACADPAASAVRPSATTGCAHRARTATRAVESCIRVAASATGASATSQHRERQGEPDLLHAALVRHLWRRPSQL